MDHVAQPAATEHWAPLSQIKIWKEHEWWSGGGEASKLAGVFEVMVACHRGRELPSNIPVALQRTEAKERSTYCS